MSTSDAAPSLAVFDELYRRDPDPWDTATRWYEERRRALVLAALPRRRYARGFEPGCGNGNLSELLATRCDRLLVSDGSDEAVRLARARLAIHANLTVVQQCVPREWPDERFDLIVLSELIYFLDRPSVLALARCATASLEPGGTIVACNWRADIEGYGHTGDAAHHLFASALPLPRACEYIDADVILGAWSDAPSVATRGDDRH